MHTKPLGTQSQSIGESPQIAREWETRQLSHEDRAGREGRHLPEIEMQQEAGGEFLRSQGIKETRQKALKEQNIGGGLEGDAKQVKRPEIKGNEEDKGSGYKGDIIHSTASLRSDVRDNQPRLRRSTGCDRPSAALSASNGRQEEVLKRTISPPVYLELGGGGIVPGIETPLSAVNAGERVGYVS